MPLGKEHFEQLILRSSDAVVATEQGGSIIFYNDGAHALLGYSREEVIGRGVVMLYPSIDEARRVMSCMRSPDYGGKGVASSIQTAFVAKDGGEIPVAITGTILYDEHQAEDGTIGFAKDIREILERDKLATLTEVAIGLSHEINNPLEVILNQIELLDKDIERLAGERDTSVEVERLDSMRGEVMRISEILERLSNMVKGDEYETAHYVGRTRMVDLSRPRAPRSAADPRLSGLRVLVADDDLGIARTMREILEADGCSVATASDGLEALERIQSEPFDVLLTDVVMPNMDGHELYQRCRALKPKLPVLLMTAFHHDKDHIIKQSRLEGLQQVIFKKPVDPDRLREALIAATTPPPARGAKGPA